MGVAPFRLARLPGILPLRMVDYSAYVYDGGAGLAREVNRGLHEQRAAADVLGR